VAEDAVEAAEDAAEGGVVEEIIGTEDGLEVAVVDEPVDADEDAVEAGEENEEN